MDPFRCSLPHSSRASSTSFQPCLLSLPGTCSSTTAPLARRPPGGIVQAASMRDDVYGIGSGGWQIDEDMIVLRKRLHEMRAAGTNYEPPSHWMGWEKRYYERYDADVYRLVGLLQAFFTNTRPGLALGLLALVALSVPTSAALVVFMLIGVLKAVLSGVHLG